MAFDHKTGELRDLQQLNLFLLKTFSALYSTSVFEIIDLAQDPDFPCFAALLSSSLASSLSSFSLLLPSPPFPSPKKSLHPGFGAEKEVLAESDCHQHIISQRATKRANRGGRKDGRVGASNQARERETGKLGSKDGDRGMWGSIEGGSW